MVTRIVTLIVYIRLSVKQYNDNFKFFKHVGTLENSIHCI